MKTTHLILAIFILVGCSIESPSHNDENILDTLKVVNTDDSYETNISEKLANEWKAVTRTNTEGNKTLDYDLSNSLIVIDFENNGYFTVYDVFINEKTKEETREKRSSGQWEIYNASELVMRHSLRDTANVDSFIIQKLEDDTLILKNSEKDFIDTYHKKE